MTVLSFSIYAMLQSIENGILEAQGFIPYRMIPFPKIKRQTIRLISVNYRVKNRTIDDTINLIESNKRLPYNTIQKTRILHLYWKQRTSECELLGSVKVKDIFPIQFQPSKIVIRWSKDFSHSYHLDSSERLDLALRDGFSSYEKLKDWFSKTYGLDIYSYFFAVIRW